LNKAALTKKTEFSPASGFSGTHPADLLHCRAGQKITTGTNSPDQSFLKKKEKPVQSAKNNITSMAPA
jgi:hypothetical protein